MNHIANALKQVGKRILFVLPVIGLIAALQAWGFTRAEIISVFTLAGVAILVYLLIIAGRQLGTIDSKLDAGFHVIFNNLATLMLETQEIKKNQPRQWQPKKNNPGNPGNPGHNPGNRDEWITLYKDLTVKKPGEDKPTGGGAFAGMLVGGALGSTVGPVGTIAGGIIGALIGNQIEYENIQKRKGPPQ